MELTFKKNPLLATLQRLQSVANSRHSLPILANVRIKAADGIIEFTTTDLELGIRRKTDGVIIQAGAITAPAGKLADIVAELPDAEIRLNAKSDRVTLECGSGTYTLHGLSDEEFPMLDAPEGEPFAIDGNILREALAKTGFAASTEEVRYFLNGIFFNFLAERTEVVATDGKQLAVVHCKAVAPEHVDGFIIPIKAVSEIAKTFADTDSVNIAIDTNQIQFSDAQSTLITRLVDGEYPKYERILPEAEALEGRAVLSREALLRAVLRVAILANTKNYAICVQLRDTAQDIHISTKTADLGEAHEVVSVETCTKAARIGFDARLLIAALSHIDAENIALEFSGELNPVIAKPAGEPGHTCLIMPMRLEA